PEAEQTSEVFVDVALDERQRTRGDEPGDDGREDIVAQRTRLADDLPRADLDDGQGQSGTGRLGTEPTRGAGVRLSLPGDVRLIRPAETHERCERIPPQRVVVDETAEGQRPGRMLGSAVVVGSLGGRSEEHTSELQSRFELVCRLLLEKKKNQT